MKKLILMIAVIPLFLFSACEKDHVNDYWDNTPPAAPTGLTVLNGDRVVDLSWNYNRESDVAGYNVYYSSSYDGKYTLLGTTTKNSYSDKGVTNGVTYYYAVDAFDFNGNESSLSKEDAHTTPRPEVYDQLIYDFNVFPSISGYSFAQFKVYPFDSNNTDVYFDNRLGVYYLKVWNDSDIQDMGATNDIWDIAYPPSTWSATKDARAYVGHTYVIWTLDNTYAKLRIKSVNSEKMTFDCSYQTIPGNKDLAIKHTGNRNTIVRTVSEK
jgi:Fibronectin type 3 domain-containing protein